MSIDSGAPLLELIKYLLLCENKASIKLARGLVLAWTPQPSDARPGSGVRFVWSRKGTHPSEVEDKIVETAVMNALHGMEKKIVIAGPTLRTALTLLPQWGSSMLAWRWVETAVLFDLTGLERERAEEWLASVERPSSEHRQAQPTQNRLPNT